MKPKPITEAQVTKRFVARLKAAQKLHPNLYYLKMSDRYHSGIPDFMIILDGEVYFVEMKAPGKYPTKIQIHVAEKLIKSGAYYFICSEMDNKMLIMSINDAHPATVLLKLFEPKGKTL